MPELLPTGSLLVPDQVFAQVGAEPADRDFTQWTFEQL